MRSKVGARSRLSVGVAVVSAAVLAGCSVRLKGLVTDSATGQPVPQCAVMIGSRYDRSDAEGRYILPIHTDWTRVTFIASGYEPKTVEFRYSMDRDSVVDVALEPLPGH